MLLELGIDVNSEDEIEEQAAENELRGAKVRRRKKKRVEKVEQVAKEGEEEVGTGKKVAERNKKRMKVKITPQGL